MIAVKPKYKTKQYYKKFVTEKSLETKHKTSKTKSYYLKILYHSMIRGQYLYSRAKPLIVLLQFPCFLKKDVRKNIHDAVMIYEKSQ